MNSQENSIGRWIATLFRRSRLALDRAFEPMGLGKGLYLYLALLSRSEGLTQRQISHEMALDQGTVARALARLEGDGWIRRERDPRDGRAFRVYLGKRGLETMPLILDELQRWNRQLVQGFSEEEAKAALMLMVRMAQNVEADETRENTGMGGIGGEQ